MYALQLRCCLVSSQIRASILPYIRCISSNSSPDFPFPTQPRPSPYEIFHLPYGCNQQQIKERYYDLVRQYHPDSPSCRLTPPSERHARFQAIRAAYDSLRKGDKIGLRNAHLFDEYADEIARRKNIFYKHQQYRNRGPNVAKGYEPRYEWNSNADDRWKDHMILGFGIVSIIVGVFPGIILFPRHARQHNEAVRNLTQARLEAAEHSVQRRLEIKSRVKEMKSDAVKNPSRT
ncbi:hypothetical protein J3R30DRAFT_3432160 [Lentinula aciculospora]|uniref:J domain-containing protein n=1 Tax=Lentinula aciculospora TaxID=153920 RepID=A0A9W9ARZ2_9AGAR|nr:hypothetical protein J3R30DRAFT_3432160 [Lentinula aciculospora]